MTLVFLPFFTSLLHPELPANALFEDSCFAGVFNFLFIPGLIVSIFVLAPLTSLFNWSEHVDLTVLFFLGGVISIFFWAFILFRIHKRFFESPEPAPVVKVPVKKVATPRKKKK